MHPALKHIIISAVTLLLCSPQLVAQEISSLQSKRLVISADTVQLDSNSIVPESLQIFANGLRINNELYSFDPLTGQFQYTAFEHIGDSALFVYRRFPFSFGRAYKRKSTEQVDLTVSDRTDPFKYAPNSQEDDLFGLKGLSKNGSISRGVLFGNNQDLSVNSTFNLELAGRITEDINVVASVTDNTIPIQANGNTLELQDFDQVFIKVFDKKRELIAGDMVLERPQSHFLNYFKKVQGLSYSQILRSDSNSVDEIRLRGAISKGKFARNSIQGEENNQGPYRLTGAANEQFIIVLSGTEKVFIDGQELIRGQENDYIIDYNTAEITFTARRLITKDKRIVVEFQYSDRNYTRSLLNASAEKRVGKVALGVEFYSEQDHKNQPFQQDLQDAERSVLSNAGDNPLAAVINGVDSIGPDNSLVLYQEKDSLGFFPIYLFSTDPDSALYRLSFANVGAGNGDYIQDGFEASGRVFKWIAPTIIGADTIRNGDHAPLRVLIPPTTQRMMVLKAQSKLSARWIMNSELAISELDRNTFSSADEADDQGMATKVGVLYEEPLDTSKNWSWNGSMNLELRGRDFQRVERYRSVEFDRNWNLLDVDQQRDQLLGDLGLGIRRRNGDRVNYFLNGLGLRNSYNGLRHELNMLVRPAKTEFRIDASLLNSALVGRTSFLRHKALIKRSFKGFNLGYQDEHELNERLSNNRDTLQLGSYQFFDWSFFIETEDSTNSRFRLQAGKRVDRAFDGSELQRATDASNLTLGFELGKDIRNRVKGNFTLRRLNIVNDSLTQLEPEDTYLGRIEYDLTALKGALNFGTFFELGAGQEQRREFVYVEVPAGQGVYVWNDYNGDGVRDLNEFEIAQFSYEANFIRVFVPTNDYVTTFTDQFSVSMDMRPRAVWQDKKGLRKFVSKFNNQTSLRNDRRTGDDISAALQIFNLNDTDTNLISYNSSLRNSTYYDRTSKNWSADLTFQEDETKSNLVNGSETRGRSKRNLGVRWNVTKQITLNIDTEDGVVFSRSDIIAGRTYVVDNIRFEPKMTWQPNTRFRISAAYSKDEKTSDAESVVNTANIDELELRARLSDPGKGSLDFSLSYIAIDYDGIENSSLGNEMLQGLRIGDNATWSLSLQRNLGKNLQADITYNGRRSEGNKTIHVGGLQLRAFF